MEEINNHPNELLQIMINKNNNSSARLTYILKKLLLYIHNHCIYIFFLLSFKNNARSNG